MSSVPGRPLPEIEDQELAARLAPLVEAVVPSQRTSRAEMPESRQVGTPEAAREPHGMPDSRESGLSGNGDSGLSDNRNPGKPESRLSDVPDVRGFGMSGIRSADSPGIRDSGLSADVASRAGLPARRVTKRGVEFLLPDRVVLALKADAARRGVSASIRLLEILRDAGYPVFPDDFIDLRKLPRRG